MAGKPSLDIALEALPATAIVSDIVYAPLETALLRAARKRGLEVSDGLGMLLHQAVPSFAAWTGVTPRVTPTLRAKAVASLAG
jgi:shikimate dehydrogenase